VGATHLLVAVPAVGMVLALADAPGVTLRLRRSVDRLRMLADLTFAEAAGDALAQGIAAG
jgi:hypothetical protein